ncbi:MAG: NUDIX domain-containing protein [Thiomicrorhabdus sp.]|nr:NUDIX domain-containing protein [Thiomicrorhabdus sp.]
MSLKKVNIQSITVPYSGFFELNVVHFKHTRYTGGWTETFSREVFQRGQAVVVLLYDLAKEQVVLVEQCRAGALLNHHHTQKPAQAEQVWLLEPVAGMIDIGESPQEAGIREAQEETGAVIHDLEYICQFYPSPGACSEILHLYAAETSVDSIADYAGLASEHEDIKVVKLSFNKAKKMLLSAEFNVAATYIALQWLFFQKIPTLNKGN